MRDLLLDAAERLLVEGGPDAVRLDAVAAAAGVSKGGLLHHFRSRQSLIGGVLQRQVEAFERQLPPRGAPPGAFTRAWLDATIPVADAPANRHADRVAVALLAAVCGGPPMLAVLRRHYQTWQRRLARDGLDPAVAAEVRLAVDGWWLARLLDLAPPRRAMHRQVRRRLDDLIDADLAQAAQAGT